MAFKQYTLTRRDGNNHRGDLIRDIQQDKDFPETSDGEALKGYLESRYAYTEATRAFENMNKEYRRKGEAALHRKDDEESWTT